MKSIKQYSWIEIIFSIGISFILTWIIKGKLSPILLSGKSFEGRSLFIQLIIIGIYIILITFVIMMIFTGIEKIILAKIPKFSLKIKSMIEKRSNQSYIIFLLMLYFCWLLYKNAWIGDDAFITMRVVDNFFNGYGLVWNVGERVQVFTHPLWLLLLTIFFSILKDPYLTLYWVSFIISLLTIYFVIKGFSHSAKGAIIASILLSCSMAFIDYCASGLENPLTYLFLTTMLFILLNRPTSIRTIGGVALLASLSAVNRLDTILFYLPVLGYQLFTLRHYWRKIIPILIICFFPLLVWEVFALIYFGFPFPNTYYAKLGAVNLPTSWFFSKAWAYIKNSLDWDPITLGMIFLSIFVITWERKFNKIAVTFGMILYFIYIISIGGDFMSGRYFSALFLVAVILLLSVDYHKLLGKLGSRIYFLIFGLTICFGLITDFPPIMTNEKNEPRVIKSYGIINEKWFYFKENNWIRYNQQRTIHHWGMQGSNLKKSGQVFATFDAIGTYGFYAGPDVYIMDRFALSDPLRARLPVINFPRIGHLDREVPAGYHETLLDGFKNHIKNPELSKYYDKLDLLVHGNIFVKDRLREIINFNLGKNDYLLETYNKSEEK